MVSGRSLFYSEKRKISWNDHSLSLVVIRCHLVYHSLSFVVTRCYSLSLVVTRCITRLSFDKRSCDCRISNKELDLCKILSLLNIDWTICLYSSFYFPVYLARFNNCIWSSVWRKWSAKIQKEDVRRCSVKRYF